MQSFPKVFFWGGAKKRWAFLFYTEETPLEFFSVVVRSLTLLEALLMRRIVLVKRNCVTLKTFHFPLVTTRTSHDDNSWRRVIHMYLAKNQGRQKGVDHPSSALSLCDLCTLVTTPPPILIK